MSFKEASYEYSLNLAC